MPKHTVTQIEYMTDYRVTFTFADKTRKTVDLAAYPKRGGVFAPLKKKAYFRKGFVDLGTICWPNGADIAPERLYEMQDAAATALPPPKKQKAVERPDNSHRTAELRS